ncbi:flagellar hook-length control protein FliK [Saccharospirillum salsuginis]|uniref:Flagellar hook-length control protein FliK n=1 Tax=Saccharospirillum salsuginis TaxID=418750 RepID=A0A918NIH7_9GAMM|nr:flagellar hook-length control protein FliK [Saccharospirillum salsuginis]GGX75623.1 hypothetical protein GCM10007392_48380 [Saccharospirillum salsuginis]
MAIDRGDAIRRPLDSTLATRPLHRGGDGIVQLPSQALEQLRQSSPAIAVVVEQANLGTREKPLFEVLLQLNNQWVRARSDRPFEPGTVLLVEAARGNEIRVLPNPEPQQLNRMIQASLSFWQAHTLPRVQATQLPTVPNTQALTQLAAEQPALRPLVQWLNQTPPLTTRAVAQWMQEFLPMPQAVGRSPLPPIPPEAGWSRPGAGSVASVGGTQTPATSTTVPQQTGPVRPPDPVIGLQRPLSALIQATQPASNRPSLAALLPTAATTTSPPAANPANTPSAVPAGRPVPLQAIGSPVQVVPVIKEVMQALASQPLQSAPTALQPPAAPPLPTLTPAAPASGQTTQWAPLPSTDGQTGRVPIEIRLAQWINLLNDRISQHPASLQQSLAQRAQQILNTQADAYPTPSATGQAQAAAGRSTTEDMQPLLQLRNLLDAFQGKTQNNAIQQALSTFNQPDTPQIQQLSIPLIWLGPSAWMNMEWWQERRKDASDKDEASKGKRLWRFRLFFELDPLAPLCADLVWEPGQTDVTFWSEDQNTLTFLNRHLDTLEEWTEGLGERRLHTRHGMPKKKTTPNPDEFKPLVDVRT